MNKLMISILAFILALQLSSCGRDEKVSIEVPSDSPDAAAVANQDPVPPAGPQVKLTGDQIDTSLRLSSVPRMNENGKFEIVITIANQGKVPISSGMNPPVHLGLMIMAGDTGDILVRDFVRTKIPVIEPGQEATVVTEVHADLRVDGNILAANLVQEGVSWFSSWGQEDLLIGAVTFCGEGKICLADN